MMYFDQERIFGDLETPILTWSANLILDFLRRNIYKENKSKKADILLTHALILTMDKEFTRFDDGAIAINGNEILAIDETTKLLKSYSSPNEIDCKGNFLLPGLVNAHTHVPMTLLRGLADDLRLDVWLMGYMMPVEREFVSPDFVRLGLNCACAEMIRCGITILQICIILKKILPKPQRKPVCGLYVHKLCSNFLLRMPVLMKIPWQCPRNLSSNGRVIHLIVPSVAPHAPYTCTPEILKLPANLAVEFDVPLHTHLAETALEVENMRNEHGMPVIPYVKKQGLFEAKVLAAHCVHIDEGEIRTLLHAKAGVAHNPSSNLKLASGVAPVKKMLE